MKNEDMNRILARFERGVEIRQVRQALMPQNK